MLTGLCDDAAIFPPGNLALEQAVPAHRDHLASEHAGLVGPFIVSAAALPRLADLVEPHERFEVAVTVPAPTQVAEVLAAADAIPGVLVVALEVVVPADVDPEEVVPVLTEALAGRDDIELFVELPRDERRPALVAALAGTSYRAKLRTGGVRADLYPDERELAEAVRLLVEAGVPFKATAGLHHALRNTDPATGFEQHGFLNLLAAVDAAQRGADTDAVVATLAERDPGAVTARVRDAAARSEEVRAAFRSFGTCSILEPRDEMADLGLPTLDLAPVTAPAPTTEGQHA
ncbi:hypothetical protein FC770_10730 [Nocardioides jishulii]|uniref:HpcH/HpaI aldolase/citrate lyase domain-containing protein n=1 Tax=Nocardioides jishulii TaxID=2575440 RepID=A0A4V6X614_9ACTN|nr:hypothetical protein FCL41_04095 [Nocardioides jishulii]TKI61833.1 hypothetical protein FC770_10730 [Nocardioides jishulii]